ncbi:hypothetical protein GRJ2_000874600 [Grus japonensis]|uniref:Endonuclease/exonuclease/phosphatase domain-containing protein n=1 Tax=Grus japonensis TaxID=30415 RepID=A0ABC9WF81_GRUJA
MSGEQGGIPVLSVRQQEECMKIICLGMDTGPAESLWVKVKGHTNMSDIVVGVCHSPPNKEEVAEAFFRHLKEASHLHVLVLMGHFNYPDIRWRHYTAEQKQSRFVTSLLLECIDNSFLTPVIKELTRGGILLDLTLTNKEELVKDMNEGWGQPCLQQNSGSCEERTRKKTR